MDIDTAAARVYVRRVAEEVLHAQAADRELAASRSKRDAVGGHSRVAADGRAEAGIAGSSNEEAQEDIDIPTAVVLLAVAVRGVDST